jgi:hypothetical protein
MAKKPRYRSSRQPEAVLQEAIVGFMGQRGWFVQNMHGNAFQKGVPDLYCFQEQLDMHRWVDVKRPEHHVYTPDQCRVWPGWKPGVWIMMGATEEWYQKLFEQPNFMEYWKPRYDKYLLDIDEIIEDIREEKYDTENQ